MEALHCKSIGIDLGDGLRQIVAPPLLPALPMLFVLLAMRELLAPTGLDFLVPATVGLAAYGALYPLLDATRPEREMVRSVALATVRRVHRATVR